MPTAAQQHARAARAGRAAGCSSHAQRRLLQRSGVGLDSLLLLFERCAGTSREVDPARASEGSFQNITHHTSAGRQEHATHQAHVRRLQTAGACDVVTMPDSNSRIFAKKHNHDSGKHRLLMLPECLSVHHSPLTSYCCD